jgi:phosphocarrier protein HPr
MVQKEFHIVAETGIHARPATLLVQAAGKFQSEVKLAYNGKEVNLKSIMAVLTLGAGKGANVTISVYGADEEAAMEGIVATMSKEGLI